MIVTPSEWVAPIHRRFNGNDDHYAGSLRWKLRHWSGYTIFITFTRPKNMYHTIQRQKGGNASSILTAFPPRFRCRLSPSSLFVTLRRHCEFHPGAELWQNFQQRSSFCNFRQSTSQFSSPRSLCLSPKIARACSSNYDNWSGKNCKLGDVDNDVLGGWELESSWRSSSRKRVFHRISSVLLDVRRCPLERFVVIGVFFR